MEIDEIIYAKVLSFLKKRKNKNLANQSHVAYLENVKPRLTLIACALSGNAIELYTAEEEGGFKDNNFFLPSSVSLFQTEEENLSFYLFRVAYLATQQGLHHQFKNGEDKNNAEARQMAVAYSSEVLNQLKKELPLARAIYEKLLAVYKSQNDPEKEIPYVWFYGKWMTSSQTNTSDKPLENFSAHKNPALTEEIKTIIKARAVEKIETIEVDKTSQEDYVLMHNFEKVETAEEFSGVWRDFDGDDQLEDHQDALDELQMRYAVRTDDPSHSVYQTEFLENTSISESSEAAQIIEAIPYDEWDYKTKSYRSAFCKLYPEKITSTHSGYFDKTITDHQSLLTALRKMLTSINNKMQIQRRQSDGNAFDIDSIVDLYVDIHNKRTPNENIYLSLRKKDKDISISLLLDTSLSSDGYAAGNRIIDVEKQVAILFGEILNENSIDFSISGFNSKTRNYSTYLTIKEFDESWEQAKHKVGEMQPAGYTRIGVALRHAGELLRLRPSKNKWLIILSDGKPNDYDRYEGRYGLEDVKQALRELKQNQINYYALAIEANAKYYLPSMFGVNHFQILSSPDELITSLVTLYEQIKFS